ncbi:hypothetical protein MHU86_15534 [Fragilaria crotonensis]|nr:hypothetical protein MHU86_15534 [Fragilaria crotonensis]
MVMQMMNASQAAQPTRHRHITQDQAALKTDDSEEDEDYSRQEAGASMAGTARKRRNTRLSPEKAAVRTSNRMPPEIPLDTQPPSPVIVRRRNSPSYAEFHAMDRHSSTTSPNPHHPDRPSPIYPDHPDHPLHDCHPELSLDSSGLVAASEARSPPPLSPFELRTGELNDTNMSEEFLRDIHEQHLNAPQPTLTPSATIHEEMENVALRPHREDPNVIAQTKPGEPSAFDQSQ